MKEEQTRLEEWQARLGQQLETVQEAVRSEVMELNNKVIYTEQEVSDKTRTCREGSE